MNNSRATYPAMPLEGSLAETPHVSAALDSWDARAILLVDLDAFFASVEQLDHPGWRGKPVIVGGDADAHGVVSTASYEARAFGVHSAMPSSTARRLCPDAIWARGNFERYREVSAQVMSILHDETPLVQQVSIDEAFLDVTPTRVNCEHPVDIARRIQVRVEALGVSCSVGVATSKVVAKVASDMDKPRGLTVVYPGRESAFLAPLPVRALSGVGAAAERVLKSHGISTLGEMTQADSALLRRIFGKNARTMQLRARGVDEAAVVVDRPVKSVSHEVTFAHDLTTRHDVHAAIASIAAHVGRRLRAKGLKGHTIALKIRFSNRKVRSVQRQCECATNDNLAFTPMLVAMLDDIWREGMEIRLLGVAVSGFDDAIQVQERLFDGTFEEGFEGAFERGSEGAGKSTGAGEAKVADKSKGADGKKFIADEGKRQSLLRATDALKDRFGEDAVRFGHELRNANNTTATPAHDLPRDSSSTL